MAGRFAAQRRILLAENGVEVTFLGVLPLATLRRRIFVQYSRVVEVSTGPYDLRRLGFRAAGTALGRRRHGFYRCRGRWLFASFRDPGQVIRLVLSPADGKRSGLSEVVLGADDPDGLAAALNARLAPVQGYPASGPAAELG